MKKNEIKVGNASGLLKNKTRKSNGASKNKRRKLKPKHKTKHLKINYFKRNKLTSKSPE